MTMLTSTKLTIFDAALYNLEQAAGRLHIETPLQEQSSICNLAVWSTRNL